MQDSDYEALKRILKERPDHALIIPDGTAIISLAGPELDNVIVITAPLGTNFNRLSDEEVNDIIVNTLKQ